MSGHLIPDHARKTLAEQDEARRRARAAMPTEQSFQNNFKHTFAAEIEMIRRGAIVTKTGTDKYGNPTVLAVAMPDGKKVPTNASARRAIRLSRFSRPFRRNGSDFRWFNFRDGGFVFNEGGRGLTLSILPKKGLPFRLYIAGYVFMLNQGKWSFRNWRDSKKYNSDGTIRRT